MKLFAVVVALVVLWSPCAVMVVATLGAIGLELVEPTDAYPWATKEAWDRVALLYGTMAAMFGGMAYLFTALVRSRTIARGRR